MKTVFKVAIFLSMFTMLIFTRVILVTAADDYVKLHKGDMFAFNYNMTYKNGTTSSGLAFIRVNAVDNSTTFSNITWNQTVPIMFANGSCINITDIVPSNASIPVSLEPFINANVAIKSLHQVGNGTDCRASWDANGVLLAINATMNATAPGIVASETITRFERRSLIPGYESVLIVAITSIAIAMITIKIKREKRRQ